MPSSELNGSGGFSCTHNGATYDERGFTTESSQAGLQAAGCFVEMGTGPSEVPREHDCKMANLATPRARGTIECELMLSCVSPEPGTNTAQGCVARSSSSLAENQKPWRHDCNAHGAVTQTDCKGLNAKCSR